MVNPNQRINKKLSKDMEKLIEIRIKKGLMGIKDAKMPKITYLLTRTEGYNNALKELEFKPERKKNDK